MHIRSVLSSLLLRSPGSKPGNGAAHFDSESISIKAMKVTPTDHPILDSPSASPDASRLCQVDNWSQPA